MIKVLMICSIEKDGFTYPLDDIELLKKSLIYGLNVNDSDIGIIGNNYELTDTLLLIKLDLFANSLNSGDTGIIYYTGHGCEKTGDLIVKDKTVSLNNFMEPLRCVDDNINRVLIIDSCYSGNVKNVDFKDDKRELSFDEILQPGIHIVSSSLSYQTSNGFKGGSDFTKTLCEVIDCAKFLKKNGYVTLFDIFQSVKREMENSFAKKQIPLYVSEKLGNIKFKLYDVPKYPDFQDTLLSDEYQIINGKFGFNSNHGKYKFEIVTNRVMSDRELVRISKEIINHYNKTTLHNSYECEKKNKGRYPTFFDIYYFDTLKNYKDNVHYNRVNWSANESSKVLCFGKEKFESFFFNEDPYFKEITTEIEQNTLSDQAFKYHVDEILDEFIRKAEMLQFKYLTYEGELEDGYLKELNLISHEIHEYYMGNADLKFSQLGLKDYEDASLKLINCISGLMYPYLDLKDGRDKVNRKELMDDSIKYFNEALDEFREIRLNT